MIRFYKPVFLPSKLFTGYYKRFLKDESLFAMHETKILFPIVFFSQP